jgi:hypothetical protein
MNNDLFTAIPDTKNSDELNLTAKKIICDKLSSILGQIATQLKTDLTHEIGALRATSPGLPNPALFHYYFKLKEMTYKYKNDPSLFMISEYEIYYPNGEKINSNICFTLNVGFPPKIISVPRPAILVAIVTEKSSPA